MKRTSSPTITQVIFECLGHTGVGLCLLSLHDQKLLLHGTSWKTNTIRDPVPSSFEVRQSIHHDDEEEEEGKPLSLVELQITQREKKRKQRKKRKQNDLEKYHPRNCC